MDEDALYSAIKHAVHSTAHRLFNSGDMTLAESHDAACQIYNVVWDGRRYQPDYEAEAQMPRERGTP